jgi:integrase/recombinase XerC
MRITEAISSFLGYLQFEKRFSQHTLISYQTDLSQFISFISGQFEAEQLADIQPMQVRTWLANLKDEGMAARSINRKLSTLKSFYKYLMRQGVVASSPLTTITGPKSGKKLPAWVETPQMEKLAEEAFFPDTPDGKTQWLTIIILYELGLRRSELVGLREGQIDFHNRTLRILGKGSKERILPVRPGLLEDIRRYLEAKPTECRGQGQALLLRENGKAVTAAWVYKTVRHYLGLVTTQEKKSPHVLRHSFATHLTNAGADLNAVKELLGHSSLAATQVYTHNSIEKLKKVHGQAHPKG